jgi:hypothetical protein
MFIIVIVLWNMFRIWPEIGRGSETRDEQWSEATHENTSNYRARGDGSECVSGSYRGSGKDNTDHVLSATEFNMEPCRTEQSKSVFTLRKETW